MPVSKKVTRQKKASLTLAQQVVQAVQLLDQVASMVTVSKSSLTKADRQKALRMKIGGEKFVPVIATLAKRFGVNIAGHPVSTMEEKLQQVQTLMPLLKRAQLLVTQLGDASLQGNADVWDSATVLYGTLNRISRKNGDVQATLAPVKEFFGRRSATVRAKKQAKGTNAATSSAPTTTPAAGTTTTEATPTPAAAPSVPSVTPAAHVPT